MTSVHARTAELLYPKLMEAWRSEEAMTAVFAACKRGPTFDRTAHGRAVVQHLFQEAWAEAHEGKPPVSVLMDRYAVLAELHPRVQGDFNLYTQVAPNLVDCQFEIKREELKAMVTALQAEFSSRTDVPNPFVEKRPKVKVTAATHPPETVRRYAYTVSMIKADGILTEPDFPNLSHRITPFGKTPAFSDTANFCQLPAVGDKFYYPTLLGMREGVIHMAFVTWGAAHEEALPREILDDGTVIFPELPECCRAFKSESGGSMLTQAMTARRGAFTFWGIWAAMKAGPLPGVMVIPRVNSVQVIGPDSFVSLVEERVTTPENQQWLTFTRGARPELLKD